MPPGCPQQPGSRMRRARPHARAPECERSPSSRRRRPGGGLAPRSSDSRGPSSWSPPCRRPHARPARSSARSARGWARSRPGRERRRRRLLLVAAPHTRGSTPRRPTPRTEPTSFGGRRCAGCAPPGTYPEVAGKWLRAFRVSASDSRCPSGVTREAATEPAVTWVQFWDNGRGPISRSWPPRPTHPYRSSPAHSYGCHSMDETPGICSTNSRYRLRMSASSSASRSLGKMRPQGPCSCATYICHRSLGNRHRSCIGRKGSVPGWDRGCTTTGIDTIPRHHPRRVQVVGVNPVRQEPTAPIRVLHDRRREAFAIHVATLQAAARPMLVQMQLFVGTVENAGDKRSR